MEGKRTTTLMVIMCLVILGLNVNSATAAQCSCCVSATAKSCCSLCIAAGGSDFVCKNTCCFPCILADPAAKQQTNSSNSRRKIQLSHRTISQDLGGAGGHHARLRLHVLLFPPPPPRSAPLPLGHAVPLILVVTELLRTSSRGVLSPSARRSSTSSSTHAGGGNHSVAQCKILLDPDFTPRLPR
nr:unnamed protein product [Digitaria exilis]